jgi:uncharacterized repeat protein (TIGR03843 family)
MTEPACEQPPEHPALTTVLADGELEIVGRLVQASNATFLAKLSTDDGDVDCVYKPIQGERPLWDFPRHTLGLREVAAYELSRAAGFDVVPVTVLADGPFGTGSLQVWVETTDVDNESMVDLVPTRSLPRAGWFACVDGLDADERSVSVIHADDPALRRMAVFDCLANNADRKGGHILASGGRVFGVDHGICFHVETKLRTLLWGWAGSELTDGERVLIARARDDGPTALAELLSEDEIEAMVRRAEVLLRRGALPRARGEWPSIPWPPF